jgi:hypothetical protein
MKLLTSFKLGVLTAVFLMFARFSPVLAATDGAVNRVLERYLHGLAAGGVCPTESVAGIFCVLANLINKMITVAGAVVFLVLVYGGLQYMVSGGDEKALTTSKSTITHAVLGLFIIFGAVLIINTILVNLGF